MTTPKRRCGDCNLCCTAMAVPDLDPPKPVGQKCAHVCSRGCRVYATRPESCRAFECMWKQGAFPASWKPNKIGVVFTPNAPGKQQMLIGHVDPARPEAWRKIEAELRRIATAMPVVLGAYGRPQWIVHVDEVKVRPEP